MYRRLRQLSLFGLLMAGLIGCNNGLIVDPPIVEPPVIEPPVEPPPKPLLEAEARVLYESLTRLFSHLDDYPLVSVNGDVQIYKCPVLGEITQTFGRPRFESSADTLFSIYPVTYSPAGCKLSDETGNDFTVDSEPGVEYLITIWEIPDGQVWLTADLDGSVDWLIDERSGTCLIDMHVHWSVVPAANVETHTGMMCEFELDFDIPVSSGFGRSITPESPLKFKHVPLV